MRLITTSLLLGGLLSSLPARADDTSPTRAPGAPSTLTADMMAPGPFTMVPPPVHGPQYGDGISDDFTLAYHGYLSAVMVASLGEKRPPPTDPNAPIVDKASTPIHSYNLNYPDAVYNTWLQTNPPGNWGSFTMGIGTAHVQGTVLIGAWNYNQGQQTPQNAAYAQTALSFYPGLNLKVDDLFHTKARLNIILGGTGGRYGTAGKYDSGVYGTPIVGGIFGLGELVGVERDYGDLTLRLEEGLGVNGHGSSGPQGTTVIAHSHLMGSYKNETIKGGIHYMTAFTQDERVAPRDPDGSIKIVGADMRVNGGIFGELFVGGSYVKLTHAQHVDGSIQVVHVSGGQSFMDNFLGTDTTKETGNDHATGSLRNLEVQYDYSFGALARYPENFWGDGPDLRITLFGIYTQVGSFDPLWDHVKKVKFGTQVIYSPLSWFQVGTRVDRVIPNLDTDPDVLPTDDNRVRSTGQNFSILSPSVTLRSSFAAHEKVTFQYSHYFYGTRIDGNPGIPMTPKPDLMQTTGIPSRPFDSNIFFIQGSMWF